MPRITGIIVVPKGSNAGSDWLWGRVVSIRGQHVMIDDLQDGKRKHVQLPDIREVKKIPIFSLVVPRGGDGTWQIGQVIGLSHVDLPFGPLLLIRDIITGLEVKLLPQYVDLLIRDKSTQLCV